MAKKKKQPVVKLPPKVIIAIVVVVIIVVLILLAIPSTRAKLLEIASTYIEIENSDTNLNDDKGKTNENKPNKVTEDAGDWLASVTMIDVGQGDAIYIVFPDGKDMLIDGGEDDSSDETLLLNYLQNTVTDGFIDYVMLTHAHSDHCGGLDVVFANFDVGAVYMPYLSASNGQKDAAKIRGTCSTVVYKEFYDAATTEKYVKDGVEYSCEINYNIGNYTISGDNYTFNAYCKDQSAYEAYYSGSGKDPNDFSPMCILEICGVKFCFTGDAEYKIENEFMAKFDQNQDVDILKVGHHGSKDSSKTPFIKFLTPEYGLISVGVNNGYDHPTQEALQRLADENVTVYRTDEKGDITVKIYDNSYSFAFSKE